jgi:3-mercaptopyruvate sulfurtransferase SseA
MAAEKSPPGVLWIDARVRKLYTKAHVPDALLLCEHESDFEDQKVEVFKALQENLERLVIVYCDGKKCEASKKIAEVIRSFHPDPQRVKVLDGGWDAWVIR